MSEQYAYHPCHMASECFPVQWAHPSFVRLLTWVLLVQLLTCGPVHRNSFPKPRVEGADNCIQYQDIVTLTFGCTVSAMYNIACNV